VVNAGALVGAFKLIVVVVVIIFFFASWFAKMRVCFSLSRARSVRKVKEKQNIYEKLVLDMSALFSLRKKKRSRLLLEERRYFSSHAPERECACRSIDRVCFSFQKLFCLCVCFSLLAQKKKKEKFSSSSAAPERTKRAQGGFKRAHKRRASERERERDINTHNAGPVEPRAAQQSAQPRKTPIETHVEIAQGEQDFGKWRRQALRGEDEFRRGE